MVKQTAHSFETVAIVAMPPSKDWDLQGALSMPCKRGFYPVRMHSHPCAHIYIHLRMYANTYTFQSLPHTPYMLEEVVKSVSEESSSSVKLQLLSAVMKMFFKRPPECQDMLGRLLEHSIGNGAFYICYRHGLVHLCVIADEEVDMDVHDRGMLYYRLLKRDVKEARKVVCGQAKAVVEESTVTHRVSNKKEHRVTQLNDCCCLSFSCHCFPSSIHFQQCMVSSLQTSSSKSVHTHVQARAVDNQVHVCNAPT